MKDETIEVVCVDPETNTKKTFSFEKFLNNFIESCMGKINHFVEVNEAANKNFEEIYNNRKNVFFKLNER